MPRGLLNTLFCKCCSWPCLWSRSCCSTLLGCLIPCVFSGLRARVGHKGRVHHRRHHHYRRHRPRRPSLAAGATGVQMTSRTAASPDRSRMGPTRALPRISASRTCCRTATATEAIPTSPGESGVQTQSRNSTQVRERGRDEYLGPTES